MLRDPRKRLILIDDHLILRQGLERLLSSTHEFVVIEEAGNAQEGMEMVREMRPDGVVVDVSLPDGADGIELTKELVSEFPSLIVVILSAHDEPEIAARGLAAGAMAYVLKNQAIENLLAVLRDAFAGKRTFAERSA